MRPRRRGWRGRGWRDGRCRRRSLDAPALIPLAPRAIQYVTYLIPLRYFLVIVRGIFLKGIGLDLLWPQAAAMTAWGLVVLALAVMRSRKRSA